MKSDQDHAILNQAMTHKNYKDVVENVQVYEAIEREYSQLVKDRKLMRDENILEKSEKNNMFLPINIDRLVA